MTEYKVSYYVRNNSAYLLQDFKKGNLINLEASVVASSPESAGELIKKQYNDREKCIIKYVVPIMYCDTL